MIVYTKKYKGDPLRAYKALMRKMSKEGFYKEFREKEYFKSKSQKNREEIARAVKSEVLEMMQENKYGLYDGNVIAVRQQRGEGKPYLTIRKEK